MDKICLIVKLEYMTRVKNKAFLITTILAPLGFVIFFAVLGFLMSRGSDNKKRIAVIDTQNLMEGSLSARDNLDIIFEKRDLAALQEAYKNKEFDGIIQIDPIIDIESTKFDVAYYGDNQLALDESLSIEKSIRKKVRDYKLKALNIDASKLDLLETDVTLVPNTIVKVDKKVSSYTSLVAGGLGGIVGYGMFFIILIYGSQVMRSVMEEKINRIVEVLMSSVTPFQLMMGKVIGVGLVGLTQIGIWLLLLPIIYLVAGNVLGIDTSATPIDINSIEGGAEAMQQGTDKIATIMQEIGQMNWWIIIPSLLFYFFMGYFAYAALFAAVGSAVGEDINEAQSLTLPIMMPLILAVYIGFSAVQAPDGSLAVWASMIPLLSSIVMPVRLPFEPPVWQILVSMVLLVATTIFLVWLAGRIYRVGILLYGKKASFKELSKWLFYR